MTEHNWKPGDVAWIKGNGMDTPAIRTARGSWVWVDKRGSNPVNGVCLAASDYDEKAHPLVVIDAEDREQVERFREIASRWADDVPYSDMARPGDLDHTTAMQAALREFAAPTPPKPDEPLGLGAVVEDSDGMLWVRVNRTRSTPWVAPVTTTRAEAYDDIDAVRVVSEGVVA